MSDVCIFHYPCLDGFTAAWVVRKKFPDIRFIRGVYGEMPPPDLKGKHVLMVDFSYKHDEMLKIMSEAATVIVIDHHKSAEAELRPLFGKGLMGVFDMDASGAMLTWENLFPGIRAPSLIKFVEDRDLWRFRFKDTRAINACLASYSYYFKAWDDLVARCEIKPEHLVMEGEAILRKQDKDIREMLPQCTRMMIIDGKEVPIANMPYSLASDAGHVLANDFSGIGGTYYDTSTNRKFSLRSVGNEDVSLMARKYGGGGHKNAAGFSQPHGWEGDV